MAAARRAFGLDARRAHETVGEPGLRIDVVHLGGDDEAVTTTEASWTSLPGFSLSKR